MRFFLIVYAKDIQRKIKYCYREKYVLLCYIEYNPAVS